MIESNMYLFIFEFQLSAQGRIEDV
jgi:hypothetical protein